jgi:uncharacterized protein DUF6883
MKLPNREHADIPSSKLQGYLLSGTHPIGKAKAGFFRAIGFTESFTDQLERALCIIAYSEDVKEVIESPYGTKYILEGEIETPTGRTVKVRTVWIIDAGQDHPRFVTAYPL